MSGHPGNGHVCGYDLPTKVCRLEGKAAIAERENASLLAELRAMREEMRESFRALGNYVADLTLKELNPKGGRK